MVATANKVTALHPLLQKSSLAHIRLQVKYDDHHPLGTPYSESAGFFMTGKIFDREKYDGIFQNPPLYPGYNIPE